MRKVQAPWRVVVLLSALCTAPIAMCAARVRKPISCSLPFRTHSLPGASILLYWRTIYIACRCLAQYGITFEVAKVEVCIESGSERLLLLLGHAMHMENITGVLSCGRSM